MESTYNMVLNTLFSITNPIKKSIKKTECKVHIYLNEYALDVLLHSKYIKEYNLIKSYISSINKGVVWADQDYRSSSHFYNPYKKRGIYGRKNAMDLALKYYENSLNLWESGNKKKSMFYLGASVHLVQDMTVPQHANIKLLDDHYQYESFVKKSYRDIEGVNKEISPYLLDSVRVYIRFNSRIALKVYKRFKYIKEDELRYYRTLRCTLPLAIRTSAGVFILFYKDISK